MTINEMYKVESINSTLGFFSCNYLCKEHKAPDTMCMDEK